VAYVVDTSIFNWLVDGKIAPDDLPSDAEYVATYVQVDEINKTSDHGRRAMLFLKFAHMRPQVVGTETMVWDVTRWGDGKWGDGALFKKLRDGLDALNKAKRNNTMDALIAEVAIANGYTLLTADRDLAKVAEIHGGTVRLYET
jgi:hypothetical protein